MIHVEEWRIFPISVSEAFDYITNIKNWPEYWPDFVRIENLSTAKWNIPGDKVTVVITFLKRERALHMELKEFKINSLVTYISQQQGLPDALHERHFKEVPSGCKYTVSVESKPRKGFTGLFDRLFIKRAVRGTLQKTLENLDQVFQKRSPSPERVIPNK